jgi:antitoxin ParD1/3/4
MELSMHVSLTDALNQYVRDKVASGFYNNASEVVREALRHQIQADALDEARLQALRAEIDKGWEEADRGDFATYRLEDINAALDVEARD